MSRSAGGPPPPEAGLPTKDGSSIFLPSGEAADPDESVRAALATVEAFTERFNARDLAGMDAMLHFPHVILSAERLLVWDGPGRMPADFFDALAASTGWDRTAYVERRPVLIAARKVHLFVDYPRHRADGSVISRHQDLWIVTRDAGRWGIKQRSC